MSSNTPLPAPTPANCALCKKSREVRPDPTAIKSQLICMALPPQVVAIQSPRGVQLTPVFPPVNEGMSCYLFEPIVKEPEAH